MNYSNTTSDSFAFGASSESTLADAKAIRFPHIPARNRDLPGKGPYRLINGHLMRIDSAHDARSDTEALKPNASISETTPASPVSQRAESPQSATTDQVSQIADYLRKKRDEIEVENSELAIASWQQHQWLLEQKEQLRSQSMAVRRTQSLIENLRCNLIEMGFCLEQESTPIESSTYQHFHRLCETFFELHAESSQLS